MAGRGARCISSCRDKLLPYMYIALVLIFVLVCALLFLAPAWRARALQATVRRELAEYLRAAIPGAEIEGGDETSFVLHTPEERDVQINLHNITDAVLGLRPNTRQGRLALYEHFAAPIKNPENLDHLTLEEHGPRILPRIVNQLFLNEMEENIPLPTRALGFTGLSVAYILDSEHHVTYFTRSHAESLGIDDRAVHDLALSNLRKIFKPEVAEAALKGQAISVIQSFDDHDAARLLIVPEHLREDQTLVAFIPDKGTLILAPAPADDDWASLHSFLPGVAKLYDRPLKVTHNGISVVPLSD
jgi:hypothetical protein